MIIRVACILCCMLFSLWASATKVELTVSEKEFLQQHPTISLGTDASWAPYVVVKPDGSISGYDSELLTLVNKYTGANFKIVTGTWDKILQDASNKKIDGLSTSAVHEDRKKYFNFSKPYISSQKLLITSMENPLKIESAYDLAGKSVGYQTSNLFDKNLLESMTNIQPKPYETLDETLDALIKGEVDATIGSSTIIYLIYQMNLPFIKVVDYFPNSKIDLVFSIRKDYPEALSILNKGLDAIAADELRTLKNKWFFENQIAFNAISFTKEEKEYLKQHPVLRVQNLKTFAPFNFEENHQAKGYSIDYLKLMADYMGVKLEFVAGKQWNEYLQMLNNNQLDIIPHITRTPERGKFITFTDFYHLEHITGMALNKSQSYKSMDDLKDKTIAVVDKTFTHTHIQKAFPQQKLYLARTTNDSIEAVALGKADVVIASLPTLEYYIQKNWYTNLKTANIQGLKAELKTSLPMGVAKENTILKSILEKVHEAIPQSDIIRLKQKWMNVQKVDETGLNKEELAYLQNKKTIKMCVLPNWLPFEQINENGQHKGIGHDIMMLVSEYINTPIVLESTTQWSQSLQNLRDRKCDILPVAMDIPSRRDAMNFTKPYVKEPFVIATKSNELFIKDVKTIGNRKVGIVKSYAFIEVLKKNNPNIQIVEVKSAQEGLEKVQSGELFGYIDIMPAIGYTIQKYGLIDLKIAGKLEHDIELSIASRNDEPLLNGIMQKALNKIDDDQMRTIVGRWIEIKVHQEFDYTKLLYVIGFFTIIILLVLYKNRSINLMNRKLAKAHEAIKEQQKMVDKYVLIVDTNLKGIITNVNDAYCKATGYSKNDLIGKSHSLMRHPSMSDEFFEHLWQTITANLSWQGEITNYTKNKEVKYFNMVIEPYFKNDVKVGYRSISEDITDKKRIEELSITDKLTGLFNRMKLDEVLAMKIEEFKRYNVAFSVVLLDIDNFKMVNDQYGHDVGDVVLKQLAAILQNNTRATDIVGRWGGEEFLIICDNTNSDNAMILSENLRMAVEQDSFEKVNHMTISLGVTQFTTEDTTASLFKRVDNALYEAKNSGKNQSVLK